MYQISKVPVGREPGRHVLVEEEHRVERLLAWYPAGPLGEHDPTTGERERSNGTREHDLVKFLAREGGTRCVRARDLQVL